MQALSFLILFVAAEITGSVQITNQPVRSAIVYLGAGNGRTTNAVATLSVRDGALEPHVQIARRGATLLLCNSDPSLHVVRVQALNGTNAPITVLTQAMPYAGFQKAFALDGFRETTMLRVMGGNDEPMLAYIAVLPHTWAALTDENGRFTIAGVPPGNHKLYVWHETLGALVRDVKAPAAVDLQFTSTALKRAD